MAIDTNLVNRIFSQPGAALKDTSITDMLRGYQQIQQQQQQNVNNNVDSLVKLIGSTTDMATMENVGKTVRDRDSRWDSMGFDVEGDIAVNIYNQKYNIMKKGQLAFDKLKEMEQVILTQEGFDAKRNEILSDDWAKVNTDMRNMYSLMADLEAAKGTNFKGSDTVSPATLKAVAVKYQGLYTNKFNLLASLNIWDIPDEDIKEFDEEFGVALSTYGPEQFQKFMFNHQRKLENLFDSVEVKTNQYYNEWQRALQSGLGGGNIPSDMDVSEYGVGEFVTVDAYKDRYDEYKQLGTKINNRYEAFYHKKYKDIETFGGTKTEAGAGAPDDLVKTFMESQKAKKEAKEKDVLGDIPQKEIATLKPVTVDLSDVVKDVPSEKTHIITAVTRKTNKINEIAKNINKLQDELNIYIEEKSDNPLINEYKSDLIRMKELMKDAKLLRKSGSIEDRRQAESLSKELKAYRYKWSEDRIKKRLHEDIDVYARRLTFAKQGEEELFGGDVRPQPGIYKSSAKERNTEKTQVLRFIKKGKDIQNKIEALLKEQTDLKSQITVIQKEYS